MGAREHIELDKLYLSERLQKGGQTKRSDTKLRGLQLEPLSLFFTQFIFPSPKTRNACQIITVDFCERKEPSGSPRRRSKPSERRTPPTHPPTQRARERNRPHGCHDGRPRHRPRGDQGRRRRFPEPLRGHQEGRVPRRDSGRPQAGLQSRQVQAEEDPPGREEEGRGGRQEGHRDQGERPPPFAARDDDDDADPR